MTDKNTLWIVTEVDEIEKDIEIEGRRNDAFDTSGEFNPTNSIGSIKKITRRQRTSVDSKILKTQMEGMLMILNDLFDQSETQTNLQLNEVELSVEINAEGQISLIGNSGKLGSKGGITLKFVRSSK